MDFSREGVEVMFEEGIDLLWEHYKEISGDMDIPLEPDIAFYHRLESAGRLRVYTVRDDEKTLIGYSAFFVSTNPHYKSSLQATQDVIFIRKECRGGGGKFIAWCDEQLREEGVQKVYHHVKYKHNWGPLLERMGYKKIEQIYARRLDL